MKVVGPSREGAAWEERFRSLTANIPGAVYRCAFDGERTMEFLSPGIEGLTGCPASDFIGNRVRSFASIIHPDDRERVGRTVHRCIKNGRPWTIEYRVVRRDGSVCRVFEKGQAVTDANGAVRYLDGVLLDDTARSKARLRLREWVYRFLAGEETANLGLCEWGPTSGRWWCSRGLRRLLGVEKEVGPRSLKEFLGFACPEDRGAVQAAFEAAAGDNLECRLRRTDGRTIRVVMTTRSHRVYHSPDRHVIAAVRDVTRERLREGAVRRLATLASGTTAPEFFGALARELVQWLGVRWVMVGEVDLQEPARIVPRVFTERGRPLPTPPSYALAGTPCATAVRDGYLFVPDDVCERFSEDVLLRNLRARGYIGIALSDTEGDVHGLLNILHDGPLQLAPGDVREMLTLFARRATAELLRLRAEEDLTRRVEELETFNEGLVDREMRVIELKEEINALCEELGRPVRYPPIWNEEGDASTDDRTAGGPREARTAVSDKRIEQSP
ncbi:MAG: PAS domain-containing protein [Kiritimatiellaeota bacterium]|nr:PAS domain-containing protein [Kiritimatiellota bacterium]